FNSNASTTYRIEFFSNATGDGSGYGEGETYLGYTTVTTDGSGNATINTTLTGVSVTAGYEVSATATVDLGGGSYGDTSEFAQNATITVNTAPVLDNSKNPALTAQNEDAGAPSGAVGTLVSALVDFASPTGQVDNVTDSDGGALLGIAITAADTTNGVWYYTIDGGTNWNALGAVSNSSARLLAADSNTRLYFVPSANYNGTISNAITFHAWDQTSGLNGGTASLLLSDRVLDQFGTASYSNNDGSVNWTTSWVETDPSGGGASSGASMITGGELRFEAAGAGSHSMYREVDLSVAVTATLSFSYHSTLGAGDRIEIQASSNGGGSYTTLTDGVFDNTNPGPGTVNIDLSAYIASNTRIRILEVTDGFGGFLYLDDVQVSFDTVTNTGGTTAYSVATDTASVVVNATNDAPTFDIGDGIVTTAVGAANDWGYSLAVQADGKFLVAGRSNNGSNDDFALVRYNADGSLDTSFSSDGIVTTAVGSATDWGLSVAVQDDGRILVAGRSNNGSNDDFALVRYNTDGSLDTSFDGDGIVTTAVGAANDWGISVALQGDGKILVAGRSFNGSDNDFALVRYNTDG
ncbi:MAG: hypothetical protein KDA85_17295, partial [Planctomycetaceae bacterium]|nr:hypothetical protein [Planctomycetaceae bacterium]